ncbi:hypothetical protein J5N97_000521 [Dioscorea zingiberensis]|uniref:Uncharacterized protein n=1 Tax=Dioscorea zingiberensis TaxID=325984 RepID=A0A9D5H1D8_9LILI|nr:hypothetical protein J5N97_000521 [Dioscorea zingiberensis]
MSTTGISSQSYCNSIGNTQQNSGGPSQSGVMKLQRRLFNLELPADEYISDGEEPEGVCLGPATENYPPIRRNEAQVSFNVALVKHLAINNSALSSGLYLERSYGLTTLNEPIQIDKMSRQQMCTEVSGLLQRSSRRTHNWERMEELVICMGRIKATKKEWLTNALKAEISERDINPSGKASQSDVAAISESPPTWARPPSSLSHNRTSGQSNSLFNTSTHSNGASMMLQQNPEVIRDRLLVDCNSIPLTPGLGSEVSHHNGVCFRTKIESNELHSYHPSIRLGFPYADSSYSSASKDFTQHVPQWQYSKVVAAEALVAISSSQAHEMQENAAHGLDQEISACGEDDATVIDDSSLGRLEQAAAAGSQGLSQRNAGKVGGEEGGSCLGTCALPTSSAVQAAVSQPQMEQQPQCGKLQEPEERSMAVTGWGKRTRRPPRQRYPIDNSHVPQK